MSSSGIPDKTARWLAYVGSFITGIIVLGMSDSKSTVIKTHAWQSIWLGLAAIALHVAFRIFDWLPIVGNLFILLQGFVGVVWLVLTLVCIISAVDGTIFKVPGIHDLAEKSASK